MRRREITASALRGKSLPLIGFSDDEVGAMVKLLQPLPANADDTLREVDNKLLIMLGSVVSRSGIFTTCSRNYPVSG